MSTEQECLTALRGTDNPTKLVRAIERLLKEMRLQAPSLPGGGGFFNGYGRVYIDCMHLELAAMECDSPYLLAQVVEQQQLLAARAVEVMERDGCSLILATNNFSGLLERESPTWGSHENYLVEEHPTQFEARILPFLVTRVYAGAGGVQCPSGDFLAAVRPEFMRRTSGGGTTSDRAIHSTSRDEHHMGPNPKVFRYHLILGDGHRSQFNLALQYGATALVLKASRNDMELAARLFDLGGLPLRKSWLYTLRRFNLLARPGRPPRVDPRALQVQRLYLESAERYAARLPAPPSWIPRLLRDWRHTLDALESDDRAWLMARLDAYTKYELYSRFLQESGRRWKNVKDNSCLQSELALLDHSYHMFSSPDSVFQQLQRAGVLSHRVGELIEPGSEAEPHVPETATRARARARLIRDKAGENLFMDWSYVLDSEGAQVRDLLDPFAQDYGPWRPVSSRHRAVPPRRPGRLTIRQRPRPADPESPTDMGQSG